MNFFQKCERSTVTRAATYFLKRQLILADRQKAVLCGKIANLTAENSLLAAKVATLEEENATLKLLIEQSK